MSRRVRHGRPSAEAEMPRTSRSAGRPPPACGNAEAVGASSARGSANASDIGGVDCERPLHRRTRQAAVEIGAEGGLLVDDLEQLDAEKEIAADHHIGGGKAF